MSYKTILTALDSKQNIEQLCAFSASIGQQFQSHLIGLHVATIPTVAIVAPMEIPDPSAFASLQQAAEISAEDIKITFERAMNNYDLPYEWRSLISTSGYASAGAIENARCSDLIIARQNDSSNSGDNTSDIDNFLYESGRPVLLIPYALTQPKPIKRILVAWNGSREATRAAFDAIPFMKHADHVDIFSFGGNDGPIRNEDQRFEVELATTLSRHGVKVSSTLQDKVSGTSAMEAIGQRLTDQSADLLVMGAYGHSRWWEMLFGGTTRGFLDKMTALTLMSR